MDPCAANANTSNRPSMCLATWTDVAVPVGANRFQPDHGPPAPFSYRFLREPSGATANSSTRPLACTPAATLVVLAGGAKPGSQPDQAPPPPGAVSHRWF